jgi:hypothetical protein
MFCSSESWDSAIVGLSEGHSRRLNMETFYFLYGPLPLPTRAATIWCGSCPPRGSGCTPAESSRRSAGYPELPRAPLADFPVGGALPYKEAGRALYRLAPTAIRMLERALANSMTLGAALGGQGPGYQNGRTTKESAYHVLAASIVKVAAMRRWANLSPAGASMADQAPIAPSHP